MSVTSVQITYLIIFLLMLFAIFLLIREVNLWYFRINERVKLLEEIRDLLEEKFGNNEDEEENKN